MPRTFESLLTVDSVYTDVEAGSKKHALQLLSGLLAQAVPEVPADDVFDSLIERERWGCTAAEGGLALPHARVAGTDQCRAVLLRLAEPIDFDGPHDEQVDLLFGFIMPDATSDEDNNDLRELTRRMLNPTLIDNLREAANQADIYSVLREDDLSEQRRTAHQLSLQDH